jgi:hypothetical protein
MDLTQEASAIVNAELDSLLILWHNHLMHGGIARKCKSSSVGGLYSTSRQYDDVNGALDDILELRKVSAVDFAVSEMIDPYKAAMHMQAKALTLGIDVPVSPRMPLDQVERDKVTKLARRILWHKLALAGVVDAAYESMI